MTAIFQRLDAPPRAASIRWRRGPAGSRPGGCRRIPLEKGRQRRAVIVAAAVAVASAFPARAAEAALTLEQAVAAALADNAQLRSMRAKADAMDQRPEQARALPNPMAAYSGMDMASGGSFPGTAEKRFMIEQPYPWFGKRALREDVARKDADIMRRDAEAMAREVVMSMKEAYFDLRAIQRVTVITRAEEDVLKRMARSAEAMNATGRGSQQDVLKAQSEITMLQPRLLELAAREAGLKAGLNALMNRPADAVLGEAVTEPAGGMPGDGAALAALAEKTRPEIQGAQLRVERAEADRRLMDKETMPDYRLGLEYRSIEQAEDMLMFTVGLDLPVWGRKNRAQIREAELMRDASRSALESVKREVDSETHAAQAAVAAARRTLAVYRGDLLPQAEARFRASEAAYQTGKADFLDLLESERFLLNARIMAAMAEGELGMSLARLERAVGADLKTAAEGGGP